MKNKIKWKDIQFVKEDYSAYIENGKYNFSENEYCYILRYLGAKDYILDHRKDGKYIYYNDNLNKEDVLEYLNLIKGV